MNVRHIWSNVKAAKVGSLMEIARVSVCRGAERGCVSYEYHIFDEQSRDYYNLEMLWGDAEQLTIDE